MGHPSKVWDRFAKRYAKSAVGDEAAYQQKLRLTRDYLRADMEVMEFGCGTGTTAIKHAPHVKRILAIDFSRKMLDIARGKAKAEQIDNITFERSAIEGFEGDPSTFDMVMGHSILHLLNDRELAISKVHELLKPGGFFVSSTICMAGKAYVMQALLPVGRWVGLLPMVKFFTIEELVGSLTDAGFEIDHRWQPDEKAAVFIVAKKAG